MHDGSEMSTRATDDVTEHDHAHDPVPDRRRFVRSLALGGAAVAAGAVAGPLVMDSVASAQTTTTASIPPTIPGADLRLVNYAISLELAASQLYTLPTWFQQLRGVPLQYARTWVQHHTDHATVLSTVAENKATTTVNATLMARFTPRSPRPRHQRRCTRSPSISSRRWPRPTRS